MHLPQDFINLISSILSPSELGNFKAAMSDAPEVSIRANDKFPVASTSLPISTQVPWCNNAFYLSERPNFTLDPLFHAGAYYVQEASSMFLHQVLQQHVDTYSKVLDMCAAPGGKSTLIAQYLNPQTGLLLSNEYVSQRAHILSENITKWGSPHTIVTNNSPEHFEQFPQFFDAILVDAPCSGEGMFRKDEGAIKEWSLDNVHKCVERQRTILHSAYQALAENGVLIYSTCTYNNLENENNVKWMIDEYDMEFLEVSTESSWNIITTEFGYRFMPHKTKGEGLFMAVLRKTTSDGKHYKSKKQKQHPKSMDNLLDWTINFTAPKTILHKDTVHAVENTHYDFICDSLSRLNVYTFGLPLATIKGKHNIPHAALALSKNINRNSFNSTDVDYNTALKFLKTEALYLPDAEQGFLLITYQNVPLGWVKNLGNRCNNNYPSNWRIRMSI